MKFRPTNTFATMASIYNIIKQEVRKIIIATNGKPLNRDITPLYSRFEPVCGLAVVTHVQNALDFFRFAPTQAMFRDKYGYCND